MNIRDYLPNDVFAAIANLRGYRVERQAGVWRIYGDGFNLWSPTPKYLPVGLPKFEAGFEKHFKILKDDVAVDVGSSIGDTTVPMCIKAKEVIAIEPHPINVAFVTANTIPYGNCTVLPYAAAPENGEMVLYTHKSPAGHSLEKRADRDQQPIKVKAYTLDKMLGDRHIDVLKLDIQGTEVPVLKNSQKTLKRLDRIIVETHGWQMGELTYPDVVRQLNPHFDNVVQQGVYVYGW